MWQRNDRKVAKSSSASLTLRRVQSYVDRSVSEKEEKAHPVHRAAMSSSSESEWLLVRERKESPLEGKNEGEGRGGEGGL